MNNNSEKFLCWPPNKLTNFEIKRILDFVQHRLVFHKIDSGICMNMEAFKTW